MGFFAEQGIAVNYVLFPSASEVIPSITKRPGGRRGSGHQCGDGFLLSKYLAQANLTPNDVDMAEPFATHDVASGFVIAFLKGVRVYMDAFGGNAINRDQVIQIMTKRTDIKDAQLWAEMTPTGSSPDGAVDLPSITASQDYFKGLGLVQVTPDPSTFVDSSFAQNAVKVLGPGTPPVPPKH